MNEAGDIALLALKLWVPISILLFAVLRPHVAAAVTIVGGLLFLPEAVAIDFPGLPDMGKESIAGVCALLGASFTAGRRLLRARPGRGLDLAFLLLLFGALGTALTNGDVQIFGPVVLPGLSTYDAISMGSRDVLRLWIPFFVGRAMFDRSDRLKELLAIVAGFGLVYAFLALIEIRVSPQLHRWIYGYHQHHFSQTVRFGGYRPMVFMAHGLAVGLFMLAATLGWGVLARARRAVMGVPANLGSAFVGAVFLACKSMGAIVYAVVIFPLVVLASPRRQLAFAALICVLVAGYPALRAADLFPTTSLVSLASGVSEDRAASLATRFDQESMLLDRARKRIWFGWGGYSRSRVFNEFGTDISATDGQWIILLGSRGLVGLASFFGMLMLPVFYARKRLRRIRDKRERILLAGLALMVALFVADLVPNGLFHNLPFLLAGALFGCARALSAQGRPWMAPPETPVVRVELDTAAAIRS